MITFPNLRFALQSFLCENWAIAYLILATAVALIIWAYFKAWHWQFKNQEMMKTLISISKVFAIIHGVLLIVAIILRLL